MIKTPGILVSSPIPWEDWTVLVWNLPGLCPHTPLSQLRLWYLGAWEIWWESASVDWLLLSYSKIVFLKKNICFWLHQF